MTTETAPEVYRKHPLFLSRYEWYRKLFPGCWVRFEYIPIVSDYNRKDLAFGWFRRFFWSQDLNLFDKRFCYSTEVQCFENGVDTIDNSKENNERIQQSIIYGSINI